MEQGTEAWVQARLGFCTASRFSDLMSNGRGGGLSKTAETYMLDLISEHLTQKPARTVKTFAMEWGTRWEPVARELYRQRTGHDVDEVGFETHGSEPWVGCSPDGVILTEGMEHACIEIKAPLTPANHLRVMLNGEIPEEHADQVQGVIWITNSEWCDFISYHDDFPDRWKLLVVRVQRDNDYIEELSTRVLRFRDEMVRRLNTIIERWE